ncbi:hypothetical protein E2C01_046128 [Portunus trituberculatus]|uniref:Uncharacterized protein n=1 Tax=Portunus trituberculatus TaxID=210409 RepID=A0A5B7G492_PORTR|nr:hypothetical protein [Portunus trituberculatus]
MEEHFHLGPWSERCGRRGWEGRAISGARDTRHGGGKATKSSLRDAGSSINELRRPGEIGSRAICKTVPSPSPSPRPPDALNYTTGTLTNGAQPRPFVSGEEGSEPIPSEVLSWAVMARRPTFSVSGGTALRGAGLSRGGIWSEEAEIVPVSLLT